jgi:hypothetical protein
VLSTNRELHVARALSNTHKAILRLASKLGGVAGGSLLQPQQEPASPLPPAGTEEVACERLGSQLALLIMQLVVLQVQASASVSKELMQ